MMHMNTRDKGQGIRDKGRRHTRPSVPSSLRPSSDEAGFTLLLAALIASVVLALGSSIFVIAQKQVLLSSIGRDSQFAFYAADTGAECALYWDIRYNGFGVTAPEETMTCDGAPLNATGRESAAPYTMTFSVDVFADADGVSGTADDSGYCVEVQVTKGTSHPFTTVHSDGYSTSCDQITTSARSLQRSVELRY
jgi:hypothetical protein